MKMFAKIHEIVEDEDTFVCILIGKVLHVDLTKKKMKLSRLQQAGNQAFQDRTLLTQFE
jgi:hypothetical protein